MIAAAPLTLERAFERHYRPFIGGGAAASTIKNYRTTIRVWNASGRESCDIRTLRSGDFSAFRDEMLESRQPATVNKYLREIRAIVRFCVADGLIGREPQIRPATVPEQCKWRPSLQEVGRIYSAIGRCMPHYPDFRQPRRNRDWWRVYVALTFVGGFRRNEFRNHVTWDCITEHGVELYAPKTKRLTFAPLLPTVQRHLEMAKKIASPGSPFILSGPGGCRQFQESYHEIGESAGLKWTPQDLRRSCVDNWFRADPTAGHIVAHKHATTAVRNYLDRRQYLSDVAPKLAIPPEFEATGTTQLLLF